MSHMSRLVLWSNFIPTIYLILLFSDWKDLQRHALFLQRLMDRIGDVRLACGLKTNLDYLAKFETARLAVKSAALGVAMLADENPNN